MKKELNQNKYTRTLFKYLLVTIFIVLFGAIYEYFSFGVYSYFMIYAFAFPLGLGVLPVAFMLHSARIHASDDKEVSAGCYSQNPETLRKDPEIEGSLIPSLWHTGVAVLTVGSIFKGILDIYGTASTLTYVYWFAGGSLLLLALAIPLIYRAAKEINES